jgi:hypothetical protein
MLRIVFAQCRTYIVMLGVAFLSVVAQCYTLHCKRLICHGVLPLS